MSTRFEMVKMKDTGLRRIISHVSTKGKHHIMATLMMYVKNWLSMITSFLQVRRVRFFLEYRQEQFCRTS